MPRHAAITVNLPPDEVQRLWRSSEGRPGNARFSPAPGDRGTEIHVDLPDETTAGKLGELVQKVTGSEPLAKVKDELRRFKQQAETGEIPRSDAVPEGELAERKLKQRPAQPLEQDELQKAGAS